MIISCKECDSSFAVDDNLIQETGSKVRCSKCNSIFVAYPQPQEADGDDDLGLDDLDASMAALEDDDESLGLTDDMDDLSDELELDLEDFDDAPVNEGEGEAAGLAADDDDEFELDLDLNDADDAELDMSKDETGGDELPDLGDFEDLAGLDDEALALDDQVIVSMKQRGLVLHRVGHGWTSAAFGMPRSGWVTAGEEVLSDPHKDT